MKNKKIYVMFLFVAVFVAGLSFREKFLKEGIAIGKTIDEQERNTQWSEMIANSVNSRDIDLVVDGNLVQLAGNKPYMDENMNIMLPESVFTKAFDCSFNCYDKRSIFIQKGSTIVTADTGNEHINIGEEAYYMQNVFSVKDNSIYVQARIMERGFDYIYRWDIATNTLYMTDTRNGENILPPRFSYKDIKKTPEVKDQGRWSTCWAFAALTALESRIRPSELLTFSVDNMSLKGGYTGSQSDGGDYTRAMSYLASWRGPVLEQDDPYGDGILNNDAPVVKHIQEMQIIESKNFESIKKAVFLYGGVESALYTSMNSTDKNSLYYNSKNYAYCYIGTKKPNHDVVIVGWDDNYPKENFNGNLEGDGAFICMNSWGESFGDNGLFYISYYDSNIGMKNVVYTGVEEIDNYDNIYQSDLAGWIGQMGYDDDTAYFSNVYEARSDEELQAISFYATGKSTEYEIYFVDNFEDEASFDDRIFVQKGALSNAGYYTIDLNEKYKLVEGVRYAVVVKIKTHNSVHPIAVEYKKDDNSNGIDLEDGCGYISLTGRSWEHVEESKNSNICLKMFTNNR